MRVVRAVTPGVATMADDELPPESQNPVKAPADWVTGDEPMTGPQASYLKTLLPQAGKDDDFDPHWTKAEASRRIDELQQETGRGPTTRTARGAPDRAPASSGNVEAGERPRRRQMLGVMAIGLARNEIDHRLAFGPGLRAGPRQHVLGR